MTSLAAVMPGRMCRPPQVPSMYMHRCIGFLELSSHAFYSASHWQDLLSRRRFCTQGMQMLWCSDIFKSVCSALVNVQLRMINTF